MRRQEPTMVGPRLIHRFGVLLAALTFLLIGYPYFDDTRAGTFLGGIASLLVLAGAVYALRENRWTLRTGLVLMLVTIGASVTAYLGGARGHPIVEASFSIFYAFATLAVFLEVIRMAESRGGSMKTAFLPSLCLIAVALAVAQTPEDASRTSRTSWGAPDLSGYWEYRTTTPLQRPEAFADKIALTPEEEAAYLKERLPAIRRERDLQLNADWWEAGGLTDGRTSLVIDPPTGRIPTRSAAARERVRTLAISFRLRPADGPEDRERYERCIMGRTVPLLAVAPNRLLQIFQTPGAIAILHEQNSDLRVIPLDDGTPLAGSVRQWQGHSRGRWEGDTLVVETANFNGRWTLQGAGPNLHLVERFRVGEADTLEYEFTVDDPESFADRWTAAFPITRAIGPVYENACHEGNYSMPLILNGARAEERARRSPTR